MDTIINSQTLKYNSEITTQRINSLINSFENIFIHDEVKDSEVAKRVISHAPIEKIEIVSEEPFKSDKGEMSSRQYDRSKKNLFLTKFKGQFFKRCPGFSQKKAITCCNYHVLNLGLQCNMNCSYCYLQGYLNTPVLTLFTNIEDALAELKETGINHGSTPLRIGTGEVIDSLSLDPLFLYTPQLISFFKSYPNWILELKTKSNFVEQFINTPHSKNVIVSWSLNPQNIISQEEHGTASLRERLDAAHLCIQAGFPVAFHLDPLIYHDEWKENYKQLVNLITTEFSPQDVLNLTIGTLRFTPEQRHIMRERFGMKSLITQAEMFVSESGKLRYDSVVRNTMFQFVLDLFKTNNKLWNISLCMETPESWIATYEKMPSQISELKSFYKPIQVLK